MSEETTLLFRPVGPRELELLAASEWRRWPPRLPEQPIFYPVTNFAYAAEIASKWNVAESGAGYVTRFQVRTAFMRRYAVQRVGTSHHTEWWIPAEELDELNANIVGRIEVIASYGAPPVAAGLTIETTSGGLLEQGVEVIVSASNNGMLKPGEAVMTAAGRLPFKAIIHVAGVNASRQSSEEIVRLAVRNALAVAAAHGFSSVAFPLIGAGTGGLDPEDVRNVMIDEISRSAYDGRVVVVT